MEDELLQKHLIEGVRLPMMKGKDTKRELVWMELSSRKA
jgi:hypothetical protein